MLSPAFRRSEGQNVFSAQYSGQTTCPTCPQACRIILEYETLLQMLEFVDTTDGVTAAAASSTALMSADVFISGYISTSPLQMSNPPLVLSSHYLLIQSSFSQIQCNSVKIQLSPNGSRTGTRLFCWVARSSPTYSRWYRASVCNIKPYCTIVDCRGLWGTLEDCGGL